MPNLPDLSKTGLKCNLHNGQKMAKPFYFWSTVSKRPKVATLIATSKIKNDVAICLKLQLIKNL